jgi:hypothetical protein
LLRLAQDLEVEPPAGAAETGSIAGKASPTSSLGALLPIISVAAPARISPEAHIDS